jgi:hypothetical protein
MPLVDLHMFRVMTRFSSCFMVSTALQVWEIYKMPGSTEVSHATGPLIWACSLDGFKCWWCNNTICVWCLYLGSAPQSYEIQVEMKWWKNWLRFVDIKFHLNGKYWMTLHASLKWNSNSIFSVEWDWNFIEFDSSKI